MPRLPFAGLVPPAALALAALLGGCAQSPALPSSQSTTDNFQKARAAGIRPVAVGDFSARADDRAVEARYLRDTLVTELQGAGVFDAASGAVVQGQLVDASFQRQAGSVAARFTVTVAGGRVVYDRELRANSTWDAGADTARERSAVYSKLVGLLFSDPGFRNAVPR